MSLRNWLLLQCSVDAMTLIIRHNRISWITDVWWGVKVLKFASTGTTKVPVGGYSCPCPWNQLGPGTVDVSAQWILDSSDAFGPSLYSLAVAAFNILKCVLSNNQIYLEKIDTYLTSKTWSSAKLKTAVKLWYSDIFSSAFIHYNRLRRRNPHQQVWS